MSQKTKKINVEKFFETFTSESTIRTYRYVLRTFYRCIYDEKLTLQEYVQRYFSEKRQYAEDIEKFFVSIKDRPPKTVKLMLAGVKTFLMENDIELRQSFWKKLKRRTKGSRAVTLDRVPSNKELKRIFMHLPVKGQALFFVLVSSGMRIGETLKLELDDINLESDPVLVEIQGKYTKSGNSRKVFISNEAKEAVIEWLKTRDEYLKTAVGRSRRYKKYPEDQRLFPFEASTAYVMWKRALNKTQNGQRDKRTQRYLLHPHVLRKFFRTRMGTVIPVDIVEALMGHEGYLTEVYRRYSLEERAKFYKQGEPTLLIFSNVGEVEELKKKVEEGKKELLDHTTKLSMENMELRTDIKVLRNEIKLVKDTIQGIFKTPFEVLVEQYGNQLFDAVEKKKQE